MFSQHTRIHVLSQCLVSMLAYMCCQRLVSTHNVVTMYLRKLVKTTSENIRVLSQRLVKFI